MNDKRLYPNTVVFKGTDDNKITYINERVLEQIRDEIKQAADKQLQIAMGCADLNDRYTHLQMENAYRQSLAVIDKYTK